MPRLAAIPGVRVPFAATPHAKEFVVDFTATGRTVADVAAPCWPGASSGARTCPREYPGLGQSVLLCVTEVHRQADIDRLAAELAEVVA